MSATLTTIAAAVRVEPDKTKGSRFVATLAPALTVADAQAVVDGVRSEWPDATHHAFAWRIDADQQRQSDDGEVSGTAGKPILDRLVGDGLEQVVLVVTRFYGGTKLGKGGLVRAYGGAAREALDAAILVHQVRTVPLIVRCGLELVGPLQGVVTAHEATLVHTDWAQHATLHIAVPEAQEASLRSALTDRAAGRLTWLDTEPQERT